MIEFEPTADSEDSVDTATFFSNVVLIEDDEAHALLISRALRGLVGEISHASTGRAAFEILNTVLADLVLCDLNLPDSNAFEIIETLKRVRPDLPVIVVTSSADIDSAIAAIQAGALDYVVKQFSGDIRSHFQLVLTKAAERKLSKVRQAKLRSRDRVLSAAASAAQDGLAILSTGASVIFENDAFRNFRLLLSGAKEDNLIDMIAAHDYQAAKSLVEQFSRQEPLWSAEIALRDTTSERRGPTHFELTLSSVRVGPLDEIKIDAGKVSDMRQYVMWVRDISQKKEQEKFQRDLLSTTTHDLKGPLGAIINSAELLTEVRHRPEAKIDNFITHIASSARNCISLIDELLSARRIQDGVYMIRPRWDSVQALLEDIVLDYLPIAKAKHIALTARPAADDLRVYADHMGIMRVLGNLVNNALKFTQQGGRVEISSERSGAEVRFSVSDNGPGIRPEDRHLLFEKYGRSEVDRAVEGTGLGLFVTKNIVDAHNGRVEVQSDVGVGTTFLVSFPDPQTL